MQGAVLVADIPDHRVIDAEARTVGGYAHAGIAFHHVVRFQFGEHLGALVPVFGFGGLLRRHADEAVRVHLEQRQRAGVGITEQRVVLGAVDDYGGGIVPQLIRAGGQRLANDSRKAGKQQVEALSCTIFDNFLIGRTHILTR